MTARSKRSAHGLTCHKGHAIGLDIGSGSVRAAVLAVEDAASTGRVVVQAMGGVPLPLGAVRDGVIIDPTVVTTAVQQLWRELRLRCRNVILGVVSPHVLVRELQMPQLSPEQQAKALPFQAREALAMPVEELVLDFAAVGPADPTTGLVDGLLVASPRAAVATAIRAVEAAGLSVLRVDLAPLAVLRSVADGRHAVEAVVDIGADLTTIAVHEHGTPRMVRTMARGSHDLTITLAERLSLGETEAEAVKRTHGLAGESIESRTLRELCLPFVSEIRSSLIYFRSTHGGHAVELVTLTGGGAHLPGLVDQLAAVLGVPVQLADPMRLLTPSPKRRAAPADPRWASALAVGLAIGAAA